MKWFLKMVFFSIEVFLVVYSNVIICVCRFVGKLGNGFVIILMVWMWLFLCVIFRLCVVFVIDIFV